MIENPSRRTLVPLLAAAYLAASTPGAASDQLFEHPPLTLSAEKVLPQSMLSGDAYRIDPRVINDGVQNTYTVHSDYGSQEITGTDSLRARLQEIRATQALEQLENSEEFKEAAKRGVVGMVDGGKALIDEPVDTTKQAARGVGQWLRNVGSSITSDDPHQDNVLETATGYDVAKRTYALQMNIDPYTDFAPFQERLGEVAKAATAGGMVTKAAVKVSTAGTLAGTVANVTSLARMKDILRDNPPSRLEEINREKLIAMGIPEYQAGALLKNYNYTPVELSVMCEALTRMGDTDGREIIVAIASSAPDEQAASFMAYHVEMIASYLETVESGDIIELSGRPWLLTGSGSLVGVFPLDYLAWTRNLAIIVEIPPDTLVALGAKHRKLVIGGQFSPRSRTALIDMGWDITENARFKQAE